MLRNTFFFCPYRTELIRLFWTTFVNVYTEISLNLFCLQQSLENRNKSLLDMLADELQKAQSNESRIRQEVYESMQKQMVIIEESYK